MRDIYLTKMDTESRPSIIKELGVWFDDLSKEFPDDKVFAVVIRGMITRLKQGEIPPRKLNKMATSPLRKDMGEVFRQLDELRNGYNPPIRSAEAKSIKYMLNNGFTSEQIIDTWKTLKQDKFWQNQELTMMSVAKQIGAIANKNKLNIQKNDPEKYFKGRLGHLVQR